MINLILAYALLTPPSDFSHDARWPGICLHDAYEFGATAKDARHAYQLARRHIEYYDERIRTRYNFTTYLDWKEQATQSMTAWDILDNVLFVPGMSDEFRMEQLARLRKHLGDEAYYGRRMPGPTPGHMFN
jgi:hypothetical protein